MIIYSVSATLSPKYRQFYCLPTETRVKAILICFRTFIADRSFDFCLSGDTSVDANLFFSLESNLKIRQHGLDGSPRCTTELGTLQPGRVRSLDGMVENRGCRENCIACLRSTALVKISQQKPEDCVLTGCTEGKWKAKTPLASREKNWRRTWYLGNYITPIRLDSSFHLGLHLNNSLYLICNSGTGRRDVHFPPCDDMPRDNSWYMSYLRCFKCLLIYCWWVSSWNNILVKFKSKFFFSLFFPWIVLWIMLQGYKVV